jgi:hypothetical protein
MVWNRDPQFRVVYHANKTVTLGVALEAAEQYGGGSAGAGEITLPAALASSYGPQLDVEIQPSVLLMFTQTSLQKSLSTQGRFETTSL